MTNQIKLGIERTEHTEDDGSRVTLLHCCAAGFCLQFAGGLCHFGAGLSVETSTDERSSVHQLGEVHSLR